MRAKGRDEKSLKSFFPRHTSTGCRRGNLRADFEDISDR